MLILLLLLIILNDLPGGLLDAVKIVIAPITTHAEKTKPSKKHFSPCCKALHHFYYDY